MILFFDTRRNAAEIHANNTRFENNTIKNFQAANGMGSPLVVTGVYVNSCANVSITSNQFTNLQIEGYVSITAVYAVLLVESSHCSVYNNTVSRIHLQSPTQVNFVLIDVQKKST